MKSMLYSVCSQDQVIHTLAIKRFIPFFLLLIFVLSSGQGIAADRSLSLYSVHTKEKIDVVYKRNGHFDKKGIKKLQWFLRDHRRNVPTKMDPNLFDVVWEVYQRSGARSRIHVISGFRSKKTNNMLRRKGRRVARNSQHTRGRAMDIKIPGVPVSKIRAIAMKMQRGGVGYYRGSFVHVDTGSVRAWPRMSRKQLAHLFPKGRTLHIPPSGKKLSGRGYKLALADYRRCKRVPCGSGLRDTQIAKKQGGGLLANIFGSKKKQPAKDLQKAIIQPSLPREKPVMQSDLIMAQNKQQPVAGNGAGVDQVVTSVPLAPIKPRANDQETISPILNEGEAVVLAAVPPARPQFASQGLDLAAAQNVVEFNEPVLSQQNTLSALEIQQMPDLRKVNENPYLSNAYNGQVQESSATAGGRLNNVNIPVPSQSVGPTASIGKRANQRDSLKKQALASLSQNMKQNAGGRELPEGFETLGSISKDQAQLASLAKDQMQSPMPEKVTIPDQKGNKQESAGTVSAQKVATQSAPVEHVSPYLDRMAFTAVSMVSTDQADVIAPSIRSRQKVLGIEQQSLISLSSLAGSRIAK